MRQTSRAGSWGLLIALAHIASARAGDDPPPPLTLPGDTTPVAAKPAAAIAPLRPSTNLLRPRASATQATAARKPVANIAGTASSSFPDLPPALDGPAEMRVSPPVARRAGGYVPPGSVSTRRMPTPAPAAREDAIPDEPPSLVLEPDSREVSQPSPDDTANGREGGMPLERIEPEMPEASSPKRRGGIFPPMNGRGRANPANNSSIRVEPRSDPAADASLKRRLEAKVKDAVGDRADDIEVRVVDRNVVIRAKVDRFWNKRGVRRTIENLPALAGYKARVEIE